MKRILCALLIILLIVPAAFASELDLIGMTDEELRILRNQIDAELDRRRQDADDIILIDDKDCCAILKSCEFETIQGKTYFTIIIDWTNLSESDACLDQFLTIIAFADSEEIAVMYKDLWQEIQPGTTYEATVDFSTRLNDRQIEVLFTDISQRTVFYRMVFDLK